MAVYIWRALTRARAVCCPSLASEGSKVRCWALRGFCSYFQPWQQTYTIVHLEYTIQDRDWGKGRKIKGSGGR